MTVTSKRTPEQRALASVKQRRYLNKPLNWLNAGVYDVSAKWFARALLESYWKRREDWLPQICAWLLTDPVYGAVNLVPITDHQVSVRNVALAHGRPTDAQGFFTVGMQAMTISDRAGESPAKAAVLAAVYAASVGMSVNRRHVEPHWTDVELQFGATVDALCYSHCETIGNHRWQNELEFMRAFAFKVQQLLAERKG
jgi:hypothetical protein